MPVFSPKPKRYDKFIDEESLNFLKMRQVVMIDEALAALGEYGEIRLIVEDGRLRYVVTQTSIDAIKWQPGSLKAKPR
jgi:hypothetical protein